MYKSTCVNNLTTAFYRNVLILLIFLFSSFYQAVGQQSKVRYGSDFSGKRRNWIGPEWWVNPPYDCEVRSSHAIVAAAPDRTAVLLPYRIKPPQQSNKRGQFSLSVDMDFSARYTEHKMVAGGFRIGRQGDKEINDYRREMIEALKFIDVLYYPQNGTVQFGRSIEKLWKRRLVESITMKLSCELYTDTFLCELSIHNEQNIEIYSKYDLFENTYTLSGGISLVTNGPYKQIQKEKADVSVSFSNFKLVGTNNLVSYRKKRTFGPILWTQFLPPQRGYLKLQTQLAYLPSPQKVSLYFRSARRINGRYKWELISTESMEEDSKTVLFELQIPDKYTKYRIINYRVKHSFNRNSFNWLGTVTTYIRKNGFKLASFSCDNGYLFPNNRLVESVTRKKPDLLAFLGDQIYEGGIPGATNFIVARFIEPHRVAMQDFFYKYYMFGWTWRNILRTTPAVIIPDDHDYYQGNIWGAGGASLPQGSTLWPDGGFVMSSRWIRSVERIYTGHLPTSEYANITLSPINIGTYFTSFQYAGIDFVVLEDRKFKSAPFKDTPIGDLQLLGVEQEKFLEKWSKTWASNTQMKVAFSQTVFASVATHRNYGLERIPFYQDSGGWPQKPRSRVVQHLTNARAFSLHGDQHLGALLWNYANEDWKGKGQAAFMIPGTANGFPRAWWPGVNQPSTSILRGNDFTGKYIDDAGNAIDVLSVANPSWARKRAETDLGDWMQAAYDKGSGWGLSTFNLKRRRVNVQLFRTGKSMKDETFKGFSKSIFVGGKLDVLDAVADSDNT